MQSALSNVRKLYSDREKRLEEKIDSIVKTENKLLNEQIDEQVPLIVYRKNWNSKSKNS